MPHKTREFVGFDNGHLMMAKSVLMGLSIPIAVIDVLGRVFMSNHKWQEMIHGDVLSFFYEQGFNAGFWDIVTRDALKQALDDVVQGKTERFLGELSFNANDEEQWFQVSLDPIDSTMFDGVVVSLFDITQQKHLLTQVGKLFSVSTQQNQALRENKASLMTYQLELQEEKNKSDALAESKTNFLATMSHEIRTPMNAIIGMAYLALKTSLTPKQRDYIDKIYQAGKGLLGILNDILDFSKLESGKMELDPHPVHIVKFVMNVMSVYDVLAQQKGLMFTFKSDKQLTSIPAVMMDEVRLRQVLSNLISNALKFTQQGGITIEVTFGQKQEQHNDQKQFMVISVHDTGIGISAEHQSKLFNDFAQADQTISRKFGGSGLGLAISAKIVALMGGDIQISSTPNVGSTFSIVIPCVYASDQMYIASAEADDADALQLPKTVLAEARVSDTKPAQETEGALNIDEVLLKIKQALLQYNGSVVDMWYDHQVLLEDYFGREKAKLIFKAIDSFDFDLAMSHINHDIETNN